MVRYGGKEGGGKGERERELVCCDELNDFCLIDESFSVVPLSVVTALFFCPYSLYVVCYLLLGCVGNLKSFGISIGRSASLGKCRNMSFQWTSSPRSRRAS